MYLLMIALMIPLVIIVLRQRDVQQLVEDSRGTYWLGVFEEAANASSRGRLAYTLCQQDPALDADREHFAEICYRGKVTPEMAAKAWVERALQRAASSS